MLAALISKMDTKQLMSFLKEQTDQMIIHSEQIRQMRLRYEKNQEQNETQSHKEIAHTDIKKQQERDIPPPPPATAAAA